MLWIGLTGGIASGKSTVAQILREEGVSVIDADLLARQVVRPGSLGYKEVCEAFGSDILDKNGEIDRRKLGQEVFTSPQKKALLESILHPKIEELRELEKKKLEQQGVFWAFYDVPLLFEKKMEPLFEAILVVYAKKDQQIERLKKKGFSEQEALQRIQNQMRLEDKILKTKYVIDNTGDFKALRKNTLMVLRELEKLFKAP
ncbi:MAG: dephospho-CoA kinase [Bdellovibrio sp.]|nr:MAG: dephospho-CoA kinase [Bdellovibrio sp.]